MLRLTNDGIFNPHRKVYTRRKFTANGRHFASMQELPWRTMAIAPTKVKQLFETGFVGHAQTDDPIAEIVASGPVDPIAPAPVEEAPVEDEDEKDLVGATLFSTKRSRKK